MAQDVSPVEFLILLSLKEGRKHGYGVIKDLQDHFGTTWEVKSGTVYPALRRLESRGFVNTSLDEAEQKEYYDITESGKRKLEEALLPIEEEMHFSSKYFDFIHHRHPGMRRMMKHKFCGGFPFGEDFPLSGDDSAHGTHHGTRKEWLEKKKKSLEKRLEMVKRALEDEGKKCEAN